MSAVPVEDLVVGERYDFETSDGTVYENAQYLGHLPITGGYGIRWGRLGTFVGIAPYEHREVRRCSTADTADA